MAIGVDIIKTTGRLIFDLVRDDEETTRSIDIPYPITDTESLQSAVNAANATYTNEQYGLNIAIQPANWRDDNNREKQWTTVGVRYELVTTATTPITPEAPTLAGGRSDEAQAEERSQEEQGQPQGEWQG